MWRSRRDDACTTPSCEVTDAIAFAAFGAPGAGPRLETPRRVGRVSRRVSYLDDRTATDLVHAICHDRPEPRYYQGAVAVYSTGGPTQNWPARNCGRVHSCASAVDSGGVSWALWCRPMPPEPRARAAPSSAVPVRRMRVVARALPGRRMRNANSDRDSLTGAAARDQDKTTGVTTPHTLEPKMAARPSAHCTLLLFWLPVATGNALRVRGLHPVP